MRHFYLMLPLLLLSSGAAWAADAWTYFADAGGALTLQVPATPVAGQDSSPGPDGKPIPMATYIVERKQGALALLVSDLSQIPDTSHSLTDGVTNLKNSAASGFSSTPLTIDGNAGYDVHLVNNAGLKIEDRIFLVGKNMYQIMTVLAPDADADSVATAQRFAGSIHFLKK